MIRRALITDVDVLSIETSNERDLFFANSLVVVSKS